MCPGRDPLVYALTLQPHTPLALIAPLRGKRTDNEFSALAAGMVNANADPRDLDSLLAELGDVADCVAPKKAGKKQASDPKAKRKKKKK